MNSKVQALTQLNGQKCKIADTIYSNKNMITMSITITEEWLNREQIAKRCDELTTGSTPSTI